MATKIQKETVKKLVKATNRRISKDNAAFEEMSPAEKRVQIARDVLAQLLSKRLVAQSGVWLTGINEKKLFDHKDIPGDPELRDILSKTKKCEGCALGGMFMCAVERADKLKLSELEAVQDFERYKSQYGKAHLNDGNISEGDAFDYMKRFFSDAQLRLIECAFEQGVGTVRSDGSPALNSAERFCPNIDDAQLRMRLVMENIVANNGVFKPAKAPVCTWVTPGYGE